MSAGPGSLFSLACSAALLPLSGTQTVSCPLKIQNFFLQFLNSQGVGFPVLHPLPSAQGFCYPCFHKSHCSLSPQLPDVSRQVSETGFGRSQSGPGHFHETGSAACCRHHPLRVFPGLSSTSQTPGGCQALFVSLPPSHPEFSVSLEILFHVSNKVYFGESYCFLRRAETKQESRKEMKEEAAGHRGTCPASLKIKYHCWREALGFYPGGLYENQPLQQTLQKQMREKTEAQGRCSFPSK